MGTAADFGCERSLFERRLHSDSQTLAAFGPASVDHGPTPASLHANQETVSARASDFGGLVGAFHDLSSCRGARSRLPADRTRPATMDGVSGPRRLEALITAPSGNPVLDQNLPCQSTTCTADPRCDGVVEHGNELWITFVSGADQRTIWPLPRRTFPQ